MLLLPEPLGPAKIVRTGKSGCCFVQFSYHFVVSVAGCTIDEPDLKLPTARMLDNVQVSNAVSIEDWNSGLESFNSRLGASYTYRSFKIVIEELGTLHSSIIDYSPATPLLFTNQRPPWTHSAHTV